MNTVFSHDELHDYSGQKVYDQSMTMCAFLLGGIGTGTVSIGSRGQFRDWEIFNSPNKGNIFPYSFFAIRTKTESGDVQAKILEARLQPPYEQATGYSAPEMAGYPRLAGSTMKVEYPFINIHFSDKDLPVEINMEAFTPFIPLNADDSGIPAAVIRYKARNTSNEKVQVTIAGTLANTIGSEGYDDFFPKVMRGGKNVASEYIDSNGVKGMRFFSNALEKSDLRYGTMALLTSDADVTVKKNWLCDNFWDGAQDFWEDIKEDGRFSETESKGVDSKLKYNSLFENISSLGIYADLGGGEEKTFEFVLAWSFPNRKRGWYPDSFNGTMRNYYSVRFPDALDAGSYLLNNIERLETTSRKFQNALYGSTYPSYILEALSSNITTIRSNTCFRTEDGNFFGWEGCLDHVGSCPGSCTHVWNYAQTLAFLFPELEHTMRRIEFCVETDADGSMAFRTFRLFGLPRYDMLPPAADGQLGTLIRLYRDWKLSGDDALLSDVWENASKALDYAFDAWDTDGDNLIDSRQHNTYDIEFYGINSMMNSIFYAALKAGAEMAEYLGKTEQAAKYKTAYEQGGKAMDALLWNGAYYIQHIDDVNSHKYQYGAGCLSDQLLGQQLAHVAGLGYILPEEHVKKAILSVYKYNFVTDFNSHESVQRAYALDTEMGLVLCAWPFGGRPKQPFIYSDEVWCGVEYQVAAHLIYEGYVDEGLTIVKALRDRFDGVRRNPWNECECGHHYARSLASWSLLTALSGFSFDMVNRYISFNPAINIGCFKTFWSTASAWGTYEQFVKANGEIEKKIDVLYGDLDECEVR